MKERKTLTFSRSLVYLRHGQTDWNRQRLCVGQVDVPLNDQGRAQAMVAARSHLLTDVTGIAYSPLVRAVETAEIVARHTGLPVVLIDNLKECHLGRLEGQIEDDPSIFDPWLAGETLNGEEPIEDFRARVWHGLDAALSAFERPLVVSHSGVFWAICSRLGLPKGPEPQNGELVEIRLP